MIERSSKLELAEGEEYLSIKLDFGVLGTFKSAAFKNDEAKKINSSAPDFKGKGVAIWINVKRKELEEVEL